MISLASVLLPASSSIIGLHVLDLSGNSSVTDRFIVEEIQSPAEKQSASPNVVRGTDLSGSLADELKAINTTGRNIPLGGPLIDNGFVLGQIDYLLRADG